MQYRRSFDAGKSVYTYVYGNDDLAGYQRADIYGFIAKFSRCMDYEFRCGSANTSGAFDDTSQSAVWLAHSTSRCTGTSI